MWLDFFAVSIVVFLLGVFPIGRERSDGLPARGIVVIVLPTSFFVIRIEVGDTISLLVENALEVGETLELGVGVLVPESVGEPDRVLGERLHQASGLFRGHVIGQLQIHHLGELVQLGRQFLHQCVGQF